MKTIKQPKKFKFESKSKNFGFKFKNFESKLKDGTIDILSSNNGYCAQCRHFEVTGQYYAGYGNVGESGVCSLKNTDPDVLDIHTCNKWERLEQSHD